MTYFHVLGVGLKASDEDVRNAYVSLARQWHPDTKAFKNKRVRQKAVKKFQSINDAYHHLRTQPQREAYIRLLRKKLADHNVKVVKHRPTPAKTAEAGRSTVFFIALKEILWPFVPRPSTELVTIDSRKANYV